MAGPRHLSVVAALGTAQTLAWASTYYLPAMLAVPMAKDLGVSTATVFAAFSMALIVSALLGPYAGRAIDRWGARPVLSGTNLVFALPRAASAVPQSATEHAIAATDSVPLDGARAKRAGVLLATVFAATWFISTAMAAHLPRLLQMSGATLATAVAVGALIGPAQVAGRLLEFGFLRRLHPLLSARLAALMHPIGAAILMLIGGPAAAVFAVMHGAGNGILTIANGTLPLVLFGPKGYGQRQGMLMVPARLAQASSPWLFGLCLDQWGTGALWLSGSIGSLALGALLAMPKPSAQSASSIAPILPSTTS